MAFIKSGTHVEIAAGAFVGCYGIVREFTLEDIGAIVLVTVEFWRGSAGQFETAFFKPEELKRRQLKPITREMIELAMVGQALEGAAP